MKHKKHHIEYISYGIVTSKIFWIIFALIYFYLTGGNYHIEHPTKELIIVEEIDHIAHAIFHVGIGILLVYLFNHLTDKKVCIEGEAKKNLYLFGIFSIILTLYKYFSRLYHKYYKHDYKEEE